MKGWREINRKNSADIRSNGKSSDDFVGDEDERMRIYFYERDLLKTIITYLMIVLTAFLLELVFFWRPHWKLYCTHSRCSPIAAKRVLLIDKYDQYFTEEVILLDDESQKYVIHEFNGGFEITERLRFFENKKIRYLWNWKTNQFERLYGLDRNILCSGFLEQKGLTDEEQWNRTLLFGDNRIEIKVQSFANILYKEVLSPFYVFQMVAIVLWSLEEYYYYGAFILAMSIFSVVSSSMQIQRNQKQLRKTVSGEDIVDVWKGGDRYEKQETRHLVPGDVIALSATECQMHCDVVLVNGSVVVDESLLTGESVPVIKSGIPFSQTDFNAKHHFKHIIFSGTKVIQTRFYGTERVKAVVIRTGFQTTKGELVRSILFPKPIDFKFNRHIKQFIIIMICIAFSGFVYTIVMKNERDDEIFNMIIKALDLITIVVPPELPAALTIASIIVDKRLRNKQVFCMSPRSINMSGCVDSVVFDKTGTLTEDELHLAEVLPNDLKLKEFSHPIACIDQMAVSPLLVCLAGCHSLTRLNSKLIGDPLDLKMFESTKWVLEEPEVDDTNKYDSLAPTVVKPSHVKNETDRPQVAILRQFPFSSNLSRMSVITRTLGDDHFELYVKGAPEVIAGLCDPNTVPKDFETKLLGYTQKSYRVLGVAYRPLEQKMNYTRIQRAQREDLERDLIFLGLVVMKNNLKDKTIETIDALHSANIRTLMATGDNLMTAISVAQECHLIEDNDSVIVVESEVNSEGRPQLKTNYFQRNDISSDISEKRKLESSVTIEKRSHLAVEGRTFNTIKEHFPELLPKLIVCGTVFARMSPENKQNLIELLQKYGYIVSMTGDGANDVGALKAANCGISLSDTEASVAAPFTSKTPNISCVTILLREGRASLVSVFGVIKYMACYNIAAFIAVLILYSYRSNLTDIQNLYQDLCVISVLVFLFGRTEPYHVLSKVAPPTSLISWTQLSSIILHILLVLAFQLMGLGLVWHQYWYEPHITDDELDYRSHDNYAVFTIQIFQYISLAIVFSKGAPYRKPFYTNIFFAVALAITTILTLYIVIAPDRPNPWMADFFELDTDKFSYKFRLVLVGLAVINFIVALILEDWIIGKLVVKMVGLTKESKYRKIAKECRDSDWLQLNGKAIAANVEQNVNKVL